MCSYSSLTVLSGTLGFAAANPVIASARESSMATPGVSCLDYCSFSIYSGSLSGSISSGGSTGTTSVFLTSSLSLDSPS